MAHDFKVGDRVEWLWGSAERAAGTVLCVEAMAVRVEDDLRPWQVLWVPPLMLRKAEQEATGLITEAISTGVVSGIQAEPDPSAKPAVSCPRCDAWQAQLSEQLARVMTLEAELDTLAARLSDAEKTVEYYEERGDTDSPTLRDFLLALPPHSCVAIAMPGDD